nr:GNAT family N-acetyltransferase [Janibacter cremeus]
MLLTGATAPPAGLSLHSSDHVDETWLAGGPPRLRDHLDVAREILALPPRQIFLTAQDSEGGTAGVVRVALNDGWAGIFGLHVAPTHRRRGIGRWLTHAAASAARDAGASLTYLQVEPSNDAAQQLYRSAGMQQHHDYVYLALRT